jgi:multiple sugar transport system substrate-binding protein
MEGDVVNHRKNVFEIGLCLMLVLFAGIGIAGASQQSQKFAGTKLVILSASDGLPDARIISPYIPAFEEETGIKVDFIELGGEALHSKVATLFAARSPEVDLVWSYAGWAAEFGSAGYLEDITDWIEPDLRADLNPAMNAVSYMGRIYGLPRFLSIRLLVYNKRILGQVGLDPNAPPTTWDEYVEIAKKCTRDTTGDGKIDQWGVLNQYGRPDSCFLTFQEIFVLTGGSMFDHNHNPVFGGKEGLLALKKLVELHELGVVDPASFGIASGNDQRAHFAQGNSAMEFGWVADYAYANDPNVSKFAGDVGISILPGLVLESGSMDGSEGYVISKFSHNKEAAYEFLKFMTRPEIQEDMCLRTGWMPVRESVFSSPQLRAANPLVDYIAEQMQYRVYRFAAPYAEEVIDMFGGEILKAVKLVKSPEDAIADSVRKAAEIVERYK